MGSLNTSKEIITTDNRERTREKISQSAKIIVITYNNYYYIRLYYFLLRPPLEIYVYDFIYVRADRE